jgi:hypothetical protein
MKLHSIQIHTDKYSVIYSKEFSFSVGGGQLKQEKTKLTSD